MKKKLKVLAILLVVAAVVFVAGCTEKTNTSKNENQAASSQETPSETSTPAVTPSETPTPAVTPSETTENMTENPTGNNTAQTGSHISNTIRKQEIAMNHTLSSSTQIVKQESD